MATFTTTQADAATVTRCDAVTVNGTHNRYVFAVTHEGLSYEWLDTDLEEGATQAQIKTAIHDTLLTMEVKQPIPTVVFTSNTDVQGNTVGSL